MNILSYQAGYIAIIGRPNTGKSTLLNWLVGEKISIISSKVQTTRHSITGILTRNDAQFVFVDTPGFQTRYKTKLNHSMNRSVTKTLRSVDVVVMVVEAESLNETDQQVLTLIPADKPVVLVVNKIDLLKDKKQLLPYLAKISALRDFAAVIPLSVMANRRADKDKLLGELVKLLPQRQSKLFDDDDLTDKSERFMASEYIREKMFRLLGDEIPYESTVEIEKFEIVGALRRIFAAILVERENHKAIVIGKNGRTLKRIASEARQDMEKLFGSKIYLEVWVKVKSGWANDEHLLRSLGHE